MICHFKNLLFLVLISFYSLVAEWQEIPNMSWDTISQLALGDINNIWASAGNEDGVFKWENGQWRGPQGILDVPQETLTAPDKLSVAQNNKLYALKWWLFPKDETLIYLLDKNQWVPMHTLDRFANDMVVINENDIWISKKTVPMKFNAFHWDGKDWQQKGNENIWEIYAGNDGSIFGVQKIFFIDGKQVDVEKLEKITEGEFGTKHNILQWDGAQWVFITALEGEFVAVTVVDKNNIWIVKGSNIYELYPYKWDGFTKKWVQKGNIKSFGRIVAGRDGTVLLQGEDKKIYKWVENSEGQK